MSLSWTPTRTLIRIVFVLVASLTFAIALADGPYSRLQQLIRNEKDASRILDLADRVGIDYEKDEEMEAAYQRLTSNPSADGVEQFKKMVKLRTLSESNEVTGKLKDAKKTASEHKRMSPIVDNGPGQSGDLLEKSAERIKHLFDFKKPEFVEPRSVGGFNFLGPLVWLLLIGGLVTVIVLLIRNLSFSKSKRKIAVSGLLEDDEPDRTADEWLEQANRLEREGLYREAVRCLYLACLARLDQHNVLRFQRQQTNWEHFNRYQALQNKPAFDLKLPTQAFDRIWYGYYPHGPSDVGYFRNQYETLCQILSQRKSA